MKHDIDQQINFIQIIAKVSRILFSLNRCLQNLNISFSYVTVHLNSI